MTNFQPETLKLIGQVQEVISQYSMALTVRQIYYQLVAKQIIENNLKSYKRLCGILSKARKSGEIDYDDIVDRSRIPIKNGSWENLKDFLNTVKVSYQKSKWTNQDKHIEVWVEKQALEGLFQEITQEYDVWLVVGKGYPSLSALNEASKRFPDKSIYILYFGDFDPTGLDIPRSIEENFTDCFGEEVNLERVALTLDDIERYDLPPAPAKKTDSRTPKFLEEYGDIVVELDALPPDVLQQKIRDSIEENLNRGQFNKDLKTEKKEITELGKIIKRLEK